MLVQNISPFRYSTFNAPCQITQVAGALYPEEGENSFYLAWSTLLHEECRTCWLQEDIGKDNTPQRKEHLCGFSWLGTSSAQTQSWSASPTGRHSLAEAHPPCAISNTPRKCPGHTGGAGERLELQESLSRCLWYPKVFPLKFTEVFLGKHSAFRLLLLSLLWRLIFGLPASVLSKNLQTIQRWKKQQSLLSRPNHKTVIFKLTCSTPAVLQEPSYFPECFQRKVRGKPLMLTKAGHWDNSRYQLVTWSQIWQLFPSNCHREMNIDFNSELSETMTFFLSPPSMTQPEKQTIWWNSLSIF